MERRNVSPDRENEDEVGELPNGNIQEQPVTRVLNQSWDSRWITVEPVIFLFMFSFGIHTPAINGLTYRFVYQYYTQCYLS